MSGAGECSAKKFPQKGKIKTKNLASARKMLILPDESERTKAETSSLQS